MADALFQKEVKIRRITTLNHVATQGLSDPARLRILELLSHKPMNADEIAKALGAAGIKKATTTVRHHLDTLKEAGLIEAARMVEVRGAVMKYYSATLRVFDCQAPADLDGKAGKLIDDTATRLLKIVKNVHEDKRFSALDKDAKCREFLALLVINAALARLAERKEYRDLLATPKKS
ncbi:ArsR/SmtB family transcription factor [Candidatus Nitrososphaera sp. FF02]|uniref:ArsR/SmtB family transcription factor n=1 Tax=Candidatus Nitrososphaera sp. FF02 TaxID=3398226 RepID=UPI0039EA562D